VTDKEISAGCAIAWMAWGLAVVLLAATWITNDFRPGLTGLAMVGIAATATIRTYFVDFTRMVRRAFEMDRDSVTSLPRR
jgi:hypothetical protein